MIKIAIIQFPGLNCEYETRRSVNAAGMNGEFFRWNDDYKKLEDYDGYIIPGGFSYEDRVRAGVIASKDPLMDILKQEVKKGKPLIGICNGAQIVVESGLIPGVSGENLASALAVNKRIKDNKVLGTGFYNVWINIKNDVEPNRCAFNYNISKGHYFSLPVAHGEGRFMMEQELLDELIKNGQTVWRYCDEQGKIKDEFPTNPNGAIYNLAGVCNSEGNVMALMPHPERTKEGQCVFGGMKEYINSIRQIGGPNSKQIQNSKLQYQPKEVGELENYQAAENSVEIFVDLIITDNEARTMAGAIHNLGYNDIEVKKKVHWEIELGARGLGLGTRELEDLIKDIILSNELLNTSKEIAYVKFPDGWKKFNKDSSWSDIKPEEVINSQINYLVKYKDDVVGQSKKSILVDSLGIKDVAKVTKRVVWQVYGSENKAEELLKKNIFHNPYSQECLRINL